MDDLKNLPIDVAEARRQGRSEGLIEGLERAMAVVRRHRFRAGALQVLTPRDFKAQAAAAITAEIAPVSPGEGD